MKTHAELKHEYHQYRDIARKLYEDVGMIDSEYVKIPEHAPVMVTEFGAFVEAIVWVPKEKLDASS